VKKLIPGRKFSLACLFIVIFGLGWFCQSFYSSVYPFGLFWGAPQDNFDELLPSPDGRYDLVVLREDRAAIDDFYYRIYVFPHASTPKETSITQNVSRTGIWLDKRYLVYAGYAVPMFRWTSPHEIEIDLDDLYDEVDEFHPVPPLETSPLDNSKAVLVSLILNKGDSRDTMP
jgi:hypothetical protein